MTFDDQPNLSENLWMPWETVGAVICCVAFQVVGLPFTLNPPRLALLILIPIVLFAWGIVLAISGFRRGGAAARIVCIACFLYWLWLLRPC